MHYGSRLLFDEVNLNLLSGNRYGLVGANGAGKSTFLKLMAAEELPSLGEIIIPNQSRIGWLRQDQFKYQDEPVIEVVIRGKFKLWEARQEKAELLKQETLDEKSGFRLAALEEVIGRYQGYTAETFAQTLLVGLGVKSAYHYQPLSTLSGGFKLRVLLAQALFEEPDILLLDEPTNHLDIMSITWLEIYLKTEFQGVLIFISHDQEFLNNLSTHILDIDYGEIREYVGNYDQYINHKTLISDQKLHERQSVEKKIDKLKIFVERFRASASRSKQALSREKMIEKMELPDIKKSSRQSPNFQFIKKRPSGKSVLEVENLSKQFNEHYVFNRLSFKVARGEKVALIGHNGIGKSTLLKVLLNKHIPDTGKATWGHEVQVAYFAQDHHEQLNHDAKAIDWLTEESLQETSENIRKALGMVLFTKDDVYKSILTLSGGEAARLLFAHMMLQKGNVLILDEPTNHLDIDAKEALAMSLKKYDGTILFVSHDRHFVAGVATRIIALTEKGITDFHGNYSNYLLKYGQDYLNRSWMAAQET